MSGREKLAHVGWDGGDKDSFFAFPGKAQLMRVERVAVEAEDALVLLGPAFGDEFQVEIRIGAVDFVSDDGMADMGEVDAELVQAPGVGLEAQE